MLAGTGARPTLLVLDLDGFKEINDRQGHAAGDDVLIKTTRAIREILGDDVVIGRLGGDEFAAVLAPASSGEYGLSALITTLEEQLGERRGGEHRWPRVGRAPCSRPADRDRYRHKAQRRRRRSDAPDAGMAGVYG